MADVSMRILLSAVGGAGVTSTIKSIASSLGSGSGGLGTVLAGVGIAAGVAAVAIGVTAVKAASDYQAAMTQLQNTTNSSDAQMQQYTATIRQLSDTTGKSQVDLSKGMYQIISANFAGADATRILTTATQAAIIANADQTQVTTGLVVTLNAFGLKASQVDTISNQMFKTLSLGRGQMGDLAGALQTGGALVAHYGVSVTDMDAILATLSTGGMKTFGTSMTGLTQLLNVMDGKTDLITKRIHALGLPFDEAKFKAMNVQQQIAYLNQTLENNKGQEVAILGSKQAATALGILGTQAGLLASNTKKLSDTQELAAEKQTAWGKVQGDFGFQMQKIGTILQNGLIDVGLKLLPVLTGIASVLSANLMPILSSVGSFLQAAFVPIWNTLQDVMTHQVIPAFMQMWKNIQPLMPTLETLGKIIGTVIVVAIMLLIRVWGMLEGAIAGVIQIVAGLLAFFTDLFTGKWSNLGKDLQVIWNGIVQVFTSIFGPILGFIGTLFSAIGAKAHQIWDGIVSWFQGILANIVAFFQNTWNTISTSVGNFFSGLGSLVQQGLTALENAFMAPFRAIGSLFTWLYNHNYYIKALCDLIVKAFNQAIGWIRNAWSAVTGWLGGLWNGLTGIASKTWGAVTSTINSWVNNGANATKSGWGAASNWLGDRWNQLKGAASTAWSAVSKVFGGIWQTYIAGPLGSLWKSISDWFGNLAKQAIDWGANLLKGFVQGIKNMIGNLGQALGNVGSSIKNFLGFHSPTKEGPGSEADQWAPNLMKMYAKGLQSALPQLQTSLALVMRPVGSTLSGASPTPGAVRVGGGTQISNGGHTFNISINTNFAPTPQQARAAVDMIEQEIGRRFRTQTNSYSSGGVF